MAMNKTEKTQKQLYSDIRIILEEFEDVDYLIEFVDKKIEQLDDKAFKARERAAKERLKPDALRDAVQGVLSDEFITIEQIAAKVNEVIDGAPVSSHKIAPRLTALVEMGIATKTSMSVPVEGQKPRKLVGYKLS